MTEDNQQPSPAQTYGGVDLSARPAPARQPQGEGNTAGDRLIVDVDAGSFESVMETSLRVPVVIDLWATWCEPCKQLTPALEEVVTELAGKVMLAKIDVDANPEIAQMFQVQTVPTVLAVVGGRPIPLFQGAQGKSAVRQVLDQLLAAAAQMGITGRLEVDQTEPEELSPEDQAIVDAIDAGNLDEAIALVKKAQTNNPARKQEYAAQLAQLELNKRLSENADAADPLSLADQFIAHGNERDAYQVLLDALAHSVDEERERVRVRLVDLLRVGADADAVRQARTRMASLLF